MVHGMTSKEASESESNGAGTRNDARGAGNAFAKIEEALRCGLLASDVDDPMAPDDLEALRAVVRAHRGEAFALAPVCVELVRAMLQSSFGSWTKVEEAWDPIARRIAETLFEDPYFNARMESLWTRVSGETP